MLAYAVLAAIAFRVLEGKLLYAILILFGGLALKTLIAAKRTGGEVPSWNAGSSLESHPESSDSDEPPN